MSETTAARCQPEILSALSQLNGHARAWGFGKKAIYAYKTFVAAAFATDVRLVQVQVKCHHCGGTGTYRDWDGYDRGPCYRCVRGITTLRFYESHVSDFRWHHPVNAVGASAVLHAVWDVAATRYPDTGPAIATLEDGGERQAVYEQAEGWGPDMPGAVKLLTDEACRLLNIVETWLYERDFIIPAARWQKMSWLWELAVSERKKYRIVLERNGESECCVCGTADVPGHLCGGRSSKWQRGWADFSRRMCATCHGRDGSLSWPEEPNPLTITPAVATWLGQPWRQGKYQPGESYD
jgi:hypothetical protein